MNNTIKTLPAIAAILIAATLVVGGTFAATSATSAFAYPVKKGGTQEDSKNGNTDTIQACKQRGSVSGFDNTAEQECLNLICTHPGNNATCVRESEAAVTPVTPPLPPVPGACPEGTTFDVALDEQLKNEVNFGVGTILCLSKLGAQDAFALVDSGITVGVVVSQPDHETCSPPFVHATVASGNPPNPITTSVCVKLG